MNALSSATWSVMLALGAALGGLVAGAWGIYPAFALDTLTFLLSAALLAQIRMPAKLASATAEKTVAAAVRQYIDGLRYLRKNLDILIITLQKAILSLFLSAGFQVVLVAIAQQVFIVGEGGGIGMGLMFGLAGVGSGIGPILARKMTGDDGPTLKKAIAVAYLISILGFGSDGAALQSAASATGDHRAGHRRRHHLGLFRPVAVAIGARARARTHFRHRIHVLLPGQRAGLQRRRRRAG